MTQLSKPVLGPAFLDSEMLQEHVVQGVLSPSGTGHCSDWCSWFIFAYFDTALKFEFTGQQNVPNSLCWEICKQFIQEIGNKIVIELSMFSKNKPQSLSFLGHF